MRAHCEKIHLCDSCAYQYPNCYTENVTFGNGKGNDNVIECDAYNQGDKECITCPSDCICCN